MAEKLEGVEVEYTHTYDEFTVFFYADRISIGKRDYNIGQCCVDMMNLGEEVLDEINQKVKMFAPAAQNLFAEKNRQRRGSRTGEAERCLGYHLFFAGLSGSEDGRAMQLPHFPAAHGRREKWAQVQGPASEGYAKYQGMIIELVYFVDTGAICRAYQRKLFADTPYNV